MNENDKLVEEQFKKLSPDLQRAINAVPWKALVAEIGMTNGLDVEQIVSLEQETMFIIYGFENPTDYIPNMVREVGISEIVATSISNSVSEKILKAIEDNIGEKVEPDKTTPTKPPLPAVPEIPPTNLPMVEKGEVVHDVPHVEQPVAPPVADTTAAAASPETKPVETKTKVPVPDYRYPGGKDPYKEPLI